MKNNLKVILLALFSTLFFTQCEHPSEFKRDNPQDPIGINFGIEIKDPKFNEIISGICPIKIFPADSSTQFNLKFVDVFVDDSLITTSNKIPLNYELNTDRFKYGFHKIKCKIYTKDNRENEESVQFYYGPLEQQKEILIDKNTISIQWDFGTKFSKYIVRSSTSEDMMNPVQEVIIPDPSVNKYTTELGPSTKILYYQIIAINEIGDSIISNIHGIQKALINTAHINDGGTANGVTVSNDGTIFLATGKDGLVAYNYKDFTFIKTGEIDLGGNVSRVVASTDNTIFLILSNGQGGDVGLNAYTFNGSTFTKVAHIHNGGDALDLAEGSDGTIYLANYCDGLRVYTYNHIEFTYIAQLEVSEDCASGVALGEDGTIFLANMNGGLKAYTFDGNTFINTDHIEGFAYDVADVVVDKQGLVIVANGLGGLKAYNFNLGKFSNTAAIDNGGSADRLSINNDGTIFLANGSDGLRAYVYSNSELINTAAIYNDGSAKDVAVGKDDTIFLANGSDGLIAYEYKWIPF